MRDLRDVRHRRGSLKPMRRVLAAFRATRRTPLLQVTKSFVAVSLSWIVAGWIVADQMPIFAAIAALLVVAPSINQSFGKGIERTIGVIVGVVIAVTVGTLLGVQAWVVLLAIALGHAVGWGLKANAGTANQITISAMLVLALGASDLAFGAVRIVETLIGAAIAVVVNALIVPPVHIEPARDSVRLLGSEIVASLERLAGALSARQTPGQVHALMIEARLLRPMRASAEHAIERASEALTLNPFGGRYRREFDEMRALLDERLEPLSMQVIGMTRALVDHYDESLASDPAALAIAEELRRAAHDVRLALHLAEVEPAPLTSAIPALTAPIELLPPRGGNWVLIGSLMEDLRRVRGELRGLDEATD